MRLKGNWKSHDLDHPEHHLLVIGVRFSIEKDSTDMRLSCRDQMRWGWMLLAVGVSAGVAGCGPSTGNVSGKVLYKGAPLNGGVVTFAGEDGKNPQIAQIAEDGSYSVEKIPVGPVKITVATKSSVKQGKQPRKNLPPTNVTPPPGYIPQDASDGGKPLVEIPAKYSDSEKSGLTYTVTSGSQSYDIKLD